MNEKKERSLRRKAIRLWLRGLTRREILSRVRRSCGWLFKWQKRFQNFGWAGLKSHSRRAHHLTGRYSARIRRLVVQARRRLLNRKVGLIGPQAIQQELRAAKLLRQMPSISTIRRILHERGLIKPPRPAPSVYYPAPTASDHYRLQAMDWTARYLHGGVKVFAFHTIDLQTHAIEQTISGDKSGLTVRRHALNAWQTLGLPDGLQMDNDAAFCGGYKRPRLFGEFVRLCLYLGIEPIFIPVGEPKRNGVVENLNGLWSRSFWQRRRFHSLSHVNRASPDFQTWYQHRYQPPALNGLSPGQAQQQATRVRLTETEIRTLPDDLPITAGRVHFIRRVDQDGMIRLFNESWKVDRRLAGDYVWATIVTDKQRLQIYHRRSAREPVRLVKLFRYKIHESVARLQPRFKRRLRRPKLFTMC
jgi:transposase InsO family protein